MDSIGLVKNRTHQTEFLRRFPLFKSPSNYSNRVLSAKASRFIYIHFAFLRNGKAKAHTSSSKLRCFYEPTIDRIDRYPVCTLPFWTLRIDLFFEIIRIYTFNCTDFHLHLKRSTCIANYLYTFFSSFIEYFLAEIIHISNGIITKIWCANYTHFWSVIKSRLIKTLPHSDTSRNIDKRNM